MTMYYTATSMSEIGESNEMSEPQDDSMTSSAEDTAVAAAALGATSTGRYQIKFID